MAKQVTYSWVEARRVVVPDDTPTDCLDDIISHLFDTYGIDPCEVGHYEDTHSEQIDDISHVDDSELHPTFVPNEVDISDLAHYSDDCASGAYFVWLRVTEKLHGTPKRKAFEREVYGVDRFDDVRRIASKYVRLKGGEKNG